MIARKYILGQTKRQFCTRLKEHQRAVSNSNSSKSALALFGSLAYQYEPLCHKNIYILLVDDVTLTVYKVMSFNIRSPLMRTLDRSVETLGRECNLCVVDLTIPE